MQYAIIPVSIGNPNQQRRQIMDNPKNEVVPFMVQFLQQVPQDTRGIGPATGTATGSDKEPGDNDKD